MAYLVFVALLCSSFAVIEAKQFINVVFLIDWTLLNSASFESSSHAGLLYGHRIGSASALAMKAIKDMKLFSDDYTVDWTFVDTHCTLEGAPALIEAWKRLPGHKLHGIIGPGCTPCELLVTMGSSYNIPQVSHIPFV